MKCQKLSYLFSVCFITLITGLDTPVYADDTEIYLGQDPNANPIKHNILFILDTSFSMRNDVKVDDNGDGDTNDAGENRGSRISVLQSAMNSLINGLGNANVGYVRMNGSESPTSSGTTRTCNAAQIAAGASQFKNNAISADASGNVSWDSKCYLPTGGAVMFPIADLDAAASSVSGEPNEFGLAIPVSSSSDDAQQTDGAASATIDLTGTILDLGSTQCDAADILTNTYTIAAITDDVKEVGGVINSGSSIDLGADPTGFRFTGVALPDSAQIISSSISFTGNTGGTDDQNLAITGGVNADSVTSFGVKNIATRTSTTATVSWSGVPTLAADDVLTTPDMSTIIQELVDDTAGWTTGDTIVILFDEDTASTGRNIHTRDTDAAKDAELTIKHCDNASGAAEEQLVGLRFQDVGVPQGATIVSAYIDFTAAPTTLNSDVLLTESPNDEVRITAHDVDDSPTFGTTGTSDVEFRDNADTSANVDWEARDMDAWTDGDIFSTPDLKTIVDEIVERGGWCGGNDMTFIFEGLDTTILRRAMSYDDDPSSAPVLRVQYDTVFDANDTGCNQRTYQIPIAQSNHDARTGSNSTSVTTTSGGMPLAQPGQDFTIGLIFSLPVEKNTTIISANLQFSANGNNASSAGTSNMFINAEASDNAANFAQANGNLGTTTRPRVTGTGIPVAWDQAAVGSDVTFNSSDVSSLVRAVTTRGGWTKDSKMAFFISDGATPLHRQAKSFDGNASRAPKLNITVQENSTNTITSKTVRERLLEINDTLTTSTLLGWTPSTGTLYESALYWRGEDVLYGKQRGQANLGGSPHAAVNGIDYRIKMERTTTSHPGSYSGGTYSDGADDSDSAGGGSNCELETTRACMHDSISGTPTYTSPIDAGLECAGNFQIFLTDGGPTSNAQSTIDAIETDFGFTCSSAAADNKKGQQGLCAVEMSEYLHDTDLSSFHDGDQSVVTYTIAFNLGDADAKTWLEQISAAGGGTSYEATSATDLLTAFGEIFNDIVSRPTSFVAPSIAANSFNRLFSRDEVYFGIFQPRLDVRWEGNVKKYRICNDTSVGCTLGDIMQNDDVTIATVKTGSEEGLFRTDAVSVWSAVQGITAADSLGRAITAGGAGGSLTDYTTRTIYTDVKDNGSGGDEAAVKDESLGNSGSTPGFKITSTSWDDTETRPVREEVCGIDNTAADVLSDTTQCIDKMLWMLGKDVLDEDEDSVVTDTRWSFSDVLHSSPVTATYGKTVGGDFIDKVIVGTNEGGLRFINGSTGDEEWVFIPNSLLGLQQNLYANPEGTHTYGFDSSPVLRINDVNGDSTIDTTDGDFIHVYISMRRGGNEIYALDISPPANSALSTMASGQIVPKFLWKVDGDDPEFSRLGHTWSEPILATIGTKVSGTNNTPDDVLIFGGGYDSNLDDDGDANDDNYGVLAGDPNLGNAIYIIDADTGSKIIDISSDSKADIKPLLMKHSIPSQVKVIDVDGDGLDDRIYVGDMGGNIWRVDLAGDITSNNAGSSVVGRLASVTDNGINGDTTADDGLYESTSSRRRFFVPPSVVQASDFTFGNGDFDYILIPSGDRSNPLEKVVSNRFYAFRDYTIGDMADQGGGLADEYPQTNEAPIIDDNTTTMIDITDVVTTGVGLDSSNAVHKAALGWYLDFDTAGAVASRTDGEKGLSAPTTADGTVIFTTYVPGPASPGTCDAAEGSGRAFNLNILSAAPALNWDATKSNLTGADVISDLGSGIPSEAVPIFTEEGVTLLVGTGGGAKNLGTVSGLPRYRTYWYQEG